MLSFLPRYYEFSRVIHSVMQSEGCEFDQLYALLTGLLDQQYVRTADWGLDKWERELGLSPDEGKTVQARRDRIVSRLRGFGTATLKAVREVAEAYDGGSIEIIENFAESRVIIKFIDTRGIPPNLKDCQEALRAVLPAHLDLAYEFRYFVWDDLNGKQWTWDQLDGLHLTWDQLEVYE
ncbi:hypothetical protein GCM10020370_54330 [Paenibacillus hodogayensis]